MAGLVQVEAMLCGVPAIASALPGVRQPITQTGMGEIFPVGDSDALADAILRVAANPEAYWKPRESIASLFSTGATVGGYEALFERLRSELA